MHGQSVSDQVFSADTNVQNEILSAEVMEKQEQSETLQKQVNRLLKEMVEKTASEKLVRSKETIRFFEARIPFLF